MKKILLFCLLIASGLALQAQSTQADFDAILLEIDQMSNFEGQDFSCVYTIVSAKPGEEQSVTQARLFRRDDTDEFLLLILQPAAERGQGYLQVDDTMWFYDPESRLFERSTIRENIESSDAQNADFDTLTYAADYRVSRWQTGTLGSFRVWLMDLEATNTDVAYERIRLTVRQDNHLILREEDYSVNGRIMRTLLFTRYSTVNNRYIPSQIMIQDELNEGERSQVTLAEPSVATIPDYVFTRDYLQRVNN